MVKLLLFLIAWVTHNGFLFLFTDRTCLYRLKWYIQILFCILAVLKETISVLGTSFVILTVHYSWIDLILKYILSFVRFRNDQKWIEHKLKKSWSLKTPRFFSKIPNYSFEYSSIVDPRRGGWGWCFQIKSL